MAIVKTFEQKDWVLKMYFSTNGRGDAPADWATASVIAVATGFKVGPEQQVNVRHGAGQATPKSVNGGNISYPWSFDNIFTSETVGPAGSLKTIEHLPEQGKFAMQLVIENGGSDLTRVLTGCLCESASMNGSGGEGINVSASGQAETYADA